MTAIKPPSGHASTLPYTGAELQGAGPTDARAHAGALSGPESASASQEPERLQGTAHSRVSNADLAAAEVGPTRQVDLAELARAVELGKLSMAQAVDRLVAGTVGSLPGALTDLERAELSELLRQAVQSDPVLGDLRSEPS